MRRGNPVREQKRAERQKAHLNLGVLLHGIGSQLKEKCWHDLEDIRMLVEKVNTELLPALDAAEAAQKAYEPYWSHRRRRYTVSTSLKPIRKKGARGKKP